MRRVFEIGGMVAGVILIAFGIGALTMGFLGGRTVNSSLSAEKIVGTADMTPSKIAAEMKGAGLTGVAVPSCSVADQAIDNGNKARCFAQYMRIHTLMDTGGKTYSQLPMNDPKRDLWVTETALTTALNTSYMASQTALFGVVVGIALLLAGVGFLVLAIGGALRNKETAIHLHQKKSAEPGTPATA